MRKPWRIASSRSATGPCATWAQQGKDRERNNCPLHPLPDGRGQGEGCENPSVIPFAVLSLEDNNFRSTSAAQAKTGQSLPANLADYSESMDYSGREDSDGHAAEASPNSLDFQDSRTNGGTAYEYQPLLSAGQVGHLPRPGLVCGGPGRLPAVRPLRHLALRTVSAGHRTPAGAGQNRHAGISHRAARYRADRGSQAGSPAALSHRDLRPPADQRAGGPGRTTHQRDLSGRFRGPGSIWGQAMAWSAWPA